MKEKYREAYYKGDRFSPTWRRFTRYLELSGNTSHMKPLEIVNPYKDDVGIVSFTLFGDSTTDRFWPRLVEPLLRNAHVAKKVLPGWGLRVYLSSSLPDKVGNALRDAGFELVIMREDPEQPYRGLLWRFLVAAEKKPFIVCDADMLLNEQSLHLNGLQHVPDWLSSDKTFFRRKMFPTNFLWPISAGSWGGKPGKNGRAAIPDIKERIEKYKHNWFGSDESFLAKEVWPLFQKEGYYTSYSTVEILFWILLVIVSLLVVFIVIKKVMRR